MKLNRQQCVLHPERGAVARCPVCKRFYCRECITEHDGQVLCRRCLLRQVEDADKEQSFMDRHGAVLRITSRPLLAAAGVLLLWLIFVTIGSMLMRFPDSFYYFAPDSSGGKGVEVND